ncbi:MAG: hypothetical protein CMK09_19040 [Ponticaulis sp.]|nr:hypothetical protein [Ponticaulis sp.]|tara:strand:- start:178256 stop:178966 length:711 start_codon:yes stop_codon:yes gene_type:complete
MVAVLIRNWINTLALCLCCALVGCGADSDTNSGAKDVAGRTSDGHFLISIADLKLRLSREDLTDLTPLSRSEVMAGEGLLLPDESMLYKRLSLIVPDGDSEVARGRVVKLEGNCSAKRLDHLSLYKDKSAEPFDSVSDVEIIGVGSVSKGTTRILGFPSDQFLGKPITVRQLAVTDINGKIVYTTHFNRAITKCVNLYIGLSVDDGGEREIPEAMKLVEPLIKNLLTKQFVSSSNG